MAGSGSLRSLWWLRVALVGLGVVLAVAFIANGSVLIGVIVGALAAVRAAVLIVWWRRRREWVRRSPRRFGNPPDGPGGGFGPG